MAAFDDFRNATPDPIRLDFANGWIGDVRLNSGDVNGRTITVEITDNGLPIQPTGITAALAYNTDPGGDLGDRVAMTAVPDTETATFRAAVPRKALLKPGPILLGIEFTVNGTKTCSRNFHGIVERAVFDSTSPDADDKLGRLEQLIADAEKATGDANAAASSATSAANKANTAASSATNAASSATSAASKANTAADKANTAASKADSAASSATSAAGNANTAASNANAAASSANTAASKADTAASDAASAAGEARDAADAARTSTIEWDQLSEDCKTKIAATASSGVPIATQEEIDQAYRDVIEPNLSGPSPLTQDDIDWAMSIINP